MLHFDAALGLFRTKKIFSVEIRDFLTRFDMKKAAETRTRKHVPDPHNNDTQFADATRPLILQADARTQRIEADGFAVSFATIPD